MVMSPVPQQMSSTAASGSASTVAEAPRRPPPPQPVHVGGEHVIQQVVARRDRVEHLAHACAASASSSRPQALLRYCRHPRSQLFGSHPLKRFAPRWEARAQIRKSDTPLTSFSAACASMYFTAASSSAGVTSSTTPASPMPTGSTKRLTPPTFFLSPPVAATTLAARSFSGGSGPYRWTSFSSRSNCRAVIVPRSLGKVERGHHAPAHRLAVQQRSCSRWPAPARGPRCGRS